MLRATLIVLSYALALLILSLTTSLILLVVFGMTWAIALGFCFGFEMAAAHRVLIHKLRKIRVMYDDELKEYTLGIFMFLIVILSALALDVVLGVIFCMKIRAICTATRGYIILCNAIQYKGHARHKHVLLTVYERGQFGKRDKYEKMGIPSCTNSTYLRGTVCVAHFCTRQPHLSYFASAAHCK